MEPVVTSSADAELRRRCEELGEQLRASIDGVLRELAQLGIHDQRAIQTAFDLSQSATSRLLSAVRSGDALATLSLIPGPEALQSMVSGVAKAGVGKASLNQVSDAIASMRAFLHGTVGGRGTLDAVLSDWVRETRASFELRHKAAAFKAMSAIRGVQADLVLTCGIVRASDDPARHDAIVIEGMLGCRRVRPTGVLRTFGMTPSNATNSLEALHGGPIESMKDVVLSDYTNMPPDTIQTVNRDGVLETTVRDLPLARSDGQNGNLVCAQVLRKVHPAKRIEGARTSGFAGLVEPPAEQFVLDVLIDDDVWPQSQPELAIYETVIRGIAVPGDPARHVDRLDMIESVQSLGRGLEMFRLAEFPGYCDLLRDVCGSVQWDTSRLRGFRVKVRYPIYGAQIGMAFPLPQ